MHHIHDHGKENQRQIKEPVKRKKPLFQRKPLQNLPSSTSTYLSRISTPSPEPPLNFNEKNRSLLFRSQKLTISEIKRLLLHQKLKKFQQKLTQCKNINPRIKELGRIQNELLNYGKGNKDLMIEAINILLSYKIPMYIISLFTRLRQLPIQKTLPIPLNPINMYHRIVMIDNCIKIIQLMTFYGIPKHIDQLLTLGVVGGFFNLLLYLKDLGKSKNVALVSNRNNLNYLKKNIIISICNIMNSGDNYHDYILCSYQKMLEFVLDELKSMQTRDFQNPTVLPNKFRTCFAMKNEKRRKLEYARILKRRTPMFVIWMLKKLFTPFIKKKTNGGNDRCNFWKKNSKLLEICNSQLVPLLIRIIGIGGTKIFSNEYLVRMSFFIIQRIAVIDVKIFWKFNQKRFSFIVKNGWNLFICNEKFNNGKKIPIESVMEVIHECAINKVNVTLLISQLLQKKKEIIFIIINSNQSI